MPVISTIPPAKKHPFEFHVSRQARDLYEFDDALFSTNGNVIFANFSAARQFAQQMNSRRDLVNFPDRAVQASHINAMGLVDEMLHEIMAEYRKNRNPGVITQALAWFNERLGPAAVEATLQQFAETFPPVSVYRSEEEISAYMDGETDGIPHREILLEEMIMLWLANLNPANQPFNELFDDQLLKAATSYNEMMPLMYGFFESQPSFGPNDQNLIDMLRAPALASPDSLFGQLDFIQGRWTGLLQNYIYRLLSSLDFIREEEKPVFGPGGPGPSQVISFDFSTAAEPEAFSPDRDWMPNCVLIAKNAFVWLDQLSKKYQRAISRLDEIPDQELDDLARWGVTGLWLIGLWERSTASKTIKQMRGNPDAVASAYSLMDYRIAADLGGESSYAGLRQKTWLRGIRLASDMVPNHMGIDSRWVIEHPDWFISLDSTPFPSYTFNGPNLSWDGRVGIYLEDHYYDNSDAAVVFKRVDFWTGSTKYIYHGNDGTSMPWNDTAQLNYLLPEVREAVIQTILHVARRFPIIRFDAAMTLAKRHYQRLWFPEPGTGGDIASRAGLGLTKEQFEAAFPVEFWREVVDRVAQEVPDTLLLAEAFWMMEGYFVRTLGMHRVYNSAFMNMLRDEKNAEYRLTIKNTLEFDPEILKRYVNFMNNPDEKTAAEQFGKGDKYFGICTLMATLPGLPMLGHGQIEGFTEKYGMEYRRAYWEEQVDTDLVNRHSREIFPLLRRRYLFAEVENFLLYDVYTGDGSVNEDVFAYSNRAGTERALVVYHNRFASAQGWIRASAAFAIKSGDSKHLEQRMLAEGLGLEYAENVYTIFRDHISGLEFIRNNREIHEEGLFVELGAYKTFVFMDFRQVLDNDQQDYARISAHLNGSGASSIEEAIRELALAPVLTPFRELVNAGMIRWLVDNRLPVDGELPDTYNTAIDEFEAKVIRLLDAFTNYLAENGETDNPLPKQFTTQALAVSLRQKLDAALRLSEVTRKYPKRGKMGTASAFAYLMQNRGKLPSIIPDLQDWDLTGWGTVISWMIVHALSDIASPKNSRNEGQSIGPNWMDEWMFEKYIKKALQDLGAGPEIAARQVLVVHTLVTHREWASGLTPTQVIKSASGSTPPKIEEASPHRILLQWLSDPGFQRLTNVNRYEDILWFNDEWLESLCWWFLYTETLNTIAYPEPEKVEEKARQINRLYTVIDLILQSSAKAEYRVENLLIETLRRNK